MKDFFLDLYEYNEWANNELLKKITEKASNDKILKLLSHIIAAQEVWLGRILNVDYENSTIWPEYSLEECKVKIPESSEEWKEFVETLDEDHFEEVHYYKNSKGITYQNKLIEILFHVINHSNYHRAQINQILSASKEQPAVIDYIFYKREEL